MRSALSFQWAARSVVAGLAALLGACSVYDGGALMPDDEPPAPIDAGGGGRFVDSGTPGTAAGSGAGGSMSTAGGAGSAGMAGRDAQPPPGCDELAGGCSPECPEVCNGQDDDCDGEADERAADADCAAPQATAACAQGVCVLVECLDDYRDCDERADNGCETPLGDPDHCGTCGRVCEVPNALASCDDGACVVAECSLGYADCDGDGLSCETELASLSHCGECNVTCGGLDNASPQCETGSCAVQDCLGNFGDCDGVGGNGCETPLDTLQNCGECGASCAMASCGGGVCTAVVCEDPTADCDGDGATCEVDLSNDLEHCGGCSRPCAFTSATPHASLACEDESCRAVCETDYGDCDENYATGCETPLLTTARHCNGCGNDCSDLLPNAAQTTCNGGVCGITTCESGYCDYDGDASNGCEREIATEGPCVPDSNCVRQSLGERDYFFCTNERTWESARNRCRMQPRGDLAAISSSEENEFVAMHRTTNSWIGARDAAIEGLWRWERDGVPFWRGGASGSVQLSQYASWGSPQPDDFDGAEDCAELWADGTWNDVSCGSTLGFVCEVVPDECPNDSSKVEPGQCGCGNDDDDNDGDGFANCVESCDSDPSKQAPGQCGCGTPDSDADGDGTADCDDDCPSDPTQTAVCLGYEPSNLDPSEIDWSTQPSSTLDCGTTTVNTTDPDGSGPAVATITNWCGTAPAPLVQDQSGGPQVVVIPLRGLSLPAGNTLRLIGSRPVILAVDGTVDVAGTIDANASGTTPGAGGNWSCGSAAGGSGSGRCGDAGESGAGGGGGAFGTAGGPGGDADEGNPGGGGAVRGDAMLVPLMGGCRGGNAGGSNATGAAGGGAVQISASGALTVTGTVRANGGTGITPNSCGDGGGTGGGSGGAIFLEAPTLNTGSAALQARGGNGGRGDESGYTIEPAGAGGAGATSAGSNGGGGGDGNDSGGGGGGGGYGRIRTLTR